MTTLHKRLFWAVIILLLITLSRVLIVNQVHVSQDEARSILRSFGTVQQIIAWQPLDWPPLYNLMLGAWQALIDAHPAILRMMSLLIYLPGATLTFQLGRKLFRNERAAWAITLAYSALGYMAFINTFLRGYAIAVTLFPALLILTIRYFDRPHWRRTLPLALVMAGLYYSTYTSVFAFLIAGLYTLIYYRQAVWQWWLPGIISFALAVPDLLYKLDFLRQRVENAADLTSHLPPVPEGLAIIFEQYLGAAATVWLILLVIAVILLVSQRKNWGRLIWLSVWIVLAPAMVYTLVATSIMFIFTPRYSWWGLLGIAIVIGAGLAQQRIVWLGSMFIMVGLMFVPLPYEDYREDVLPYESVFRWLQQEVIPGDVLVIDPNFCIVNCGRGEIWVYYANYFLDDLMPIVEEPGDYARVWYLMSVNNFDAAMDAKIRTNRLAGKFVGPPGFLVRLHESPPDITGVLFENGLRFHGFAVLDGDRVLLPPYDIREFSTLTLRLWWSIDHPLEAEYSISTTLMADRNNRLLAQSDGAPQPVHFSPNAFEPLPNSMLEWQPGELYVSERTITIDDIGTWYDSTLYLIVYQWWDGDRIAAPGTNDKTMLPLADVLVMGW